MGGYEELIAGIKAVVRKNGRREITGDALQQVLVSMVSAIGANSAFAGVANPDTNPGSPDANVFWIAAQPGTYTHFGNAVVTASAILSNETGEWVATPLNFGAGDSLPEVELIQTGYPTTGYVRKVKERTYKFSAALLALKFYGPIPDGDVYLDFFGKGMRRGKKMISLFSMNLANCNKSPVGDQQSRGYRMEPATTFRVQSVYLEMTAANLLAANCVKDIAENSTLNIICDRIIDSYEGIEQLEIVANGVRGLANFFATEKADGPSRSYLSFPMWYRLRVGDRVGPAYAFRAIMRFCVTGYRFFLSLPSNGSYNGFVRVQ